MPLTEQNRPQKETKCLILSDFSPTSAMEKQSGCSAIGWTGFFTLWLFSGLARRYGKNHSSSLIAVPQRITFTLCFLLRQVPIERFALLSFACSGFGRTEAIHTRDLTIFRGYRPILTRLQATAFLWRNCSP